MRRHHHRPIRANERLYREYLVAGQPQTHLAPVLVRHVLVSPFPNRQDRRVGEAGARRCPVPSPPCRRRHRLLPSHGPSDDSRRRLAWRISPRVRFLSKPALRLPRSGVGNAHASSASLASRHSLIPPIASIQLSRAIPLSRCERRSREVRAGMLMLSGLRSPSLVIASTAQCVKKCWYLYRTGGDIHAPSVARSMAITTPWSPHFCAEVCCLPTQRSWSLDIAYQAPNLRPLLVTHCYRRPFQRSSLIDNRMVHNPSVSHSPVRVRGLPTVVANCTSKRS